MNICVITAFNAAYADIADLSLPLLKTYCDRHGYALEVGKYREDPDDLEMWGDRGKWGLFLAWVEKYDIIMWLDIDVLVMNHEIKIEDVLDYRPFLWTYDSNGPCSGFWIARCTPPMFVTACRIREEAKFGRDVIARYVDHPKRTVVQFEPYGASDQATMIRLMTRPPHSYILQNCVSLKEAGHCFDFRALKIDPIYDYIGNYEPGDWLYTVPSLPLPERKQFLAAKALEFYDAIPELSTALGHHREYAAAVAVGELAGADA